MKSVIKISMLLMLVALASCKREEQKLEINGKIVGADTKELVLVKLNQDLLRCDTLIKIPVKEGKFHYESKLQYPEAVKLIFSESVKRGYLTYMPLFLENEKLDLIIYDEENFDKNTIKGSKLNTEYQKVNKELQKKFYTKTEALNDSIQVLSKNNEYLNKDATKLLERAKKAKKREEQLALYEKFNKMQELGMHSTPKGKKLDDQIKVIRNKYKKFIEDYIENHQSIVAYYLFIKHLERFKKTVNVDWANKMHKLLSKANPNHPYNELSLSLIKAIENIKVGQQFIDFTLPDLKGKNHTLSNEIKGKVVLLDLWATWCGGCIAKTKTMLPIYEEFKDKGFTIVGVAGELKNTENLKNFLAKNKWSWLQLVELDKKNKIWEKYGVRGGGSVFLIDKEGKIIAVKPTAEEVRKELEKRLK